MLNNQPLSGWSGINTLINIKSRLRQDDPFPPGRLYFHKEVYAMSPTTDAMDILNPLSNTNLANAKSLNQAVAVLQCLSVGRPCTYFHE